MICPVCSKILKKDSNSYKCENNHCFDISKEGYINLLLNSKGSGDNKEMIINRYLFLNKGYYKPLLDNIIDIIKSLNVKTILDVGCGEGYYDNGIFNETKIQVTGVDISKEACIRASKTNKNNLYIVSSANKLPFSNNEFDLLINIFAPHFENEFTRVCNKYILKVIPNKNHLLELKQLLYNDVHIKEEKKLSFDCFKEILSRNVSYNVVINDLLELFKMTPYYYKTKYDLEVFNNNKNINMTCDFTILLYEKIS